MKKYLIPRERCMKNLSYLLLLISFTFSFLGCQRLVKQDNNNQESPNIIFILTDDMGWGDLGSFYQNKRKKRHGTSEPWLSTPNLDRLAENGAKLLHHYAGAPVCAPSRASLLLGVTQGHANVRNNQFDKALADNHTISSILKEAGYATAVIGKWGLQGKSSNWPAHPLNRGFDYFLGYMRHGDGHEHYPKEGIYRGRKEVWQNRTNITPKLDKSYTADLWTAAAKHWIIDHEKNKDNEPFFLYLAYDTPHAVMELPTQVYPAGGGLEGGLQWTGETGHMINTASGKVDSWVHPDYANATYDHDNVSSTPEISWPDVYKRYATSTRRIDSGIGDLRKLLEDLEIESNTLIVFSSDNGPTNASYLPESFKPSFFKNYGPFDGIKRDTWEGGVRMPTLAYWPDYIPPGNTINSPNAHYDWLATFADAAGIPAPANTDGVSLIPSLTKSGEQEKSLIYVEYFHKRRTPEYKDFEKERQGLRRKQMQMLRFDDYVGVRYNIKSHSDDFEIYNVAADPGQKHNLNKNQTPEIESLQRKMKNHALQVRIPNKSARRPYDDALVPAVRNVETEQGVKWSAFNGEFPWVPKVSSERASETGFANRPQLFECREHQALLFEGYIDIPEDGKYTFLLETGSPALMRIHEATVINADRGHRNKSNQIKGEIRLEAGLHPFRFTALCTGEIVPGLSLKWKGPGIAKRLIPDNIFVRDK